MELGQNDVERLIALPKFAEPPSEWVDRPNNGNQKELVFGVTTSEGRRLSDLRVEVRLRFGKLVDDKKWAFGFYYVRPLYASVERIYMVEVLQPHVLGHQDATVGQIYGPHERIGGLTVKADPAMYEWTFAECMGWFARKINLTLAGSVPDPFALILSS